MALNYASKYSPVVDERFKLASITQNAFNNDYEWDGVQTVNVYSVDVAPLNNYTMSGNQRYGTPGELGTSLQPLTLAQDKGFTTTIDRRNYSDQMMVTEAGAALRRQIDEVIIPHIDIYRIAQLAANAGNTGTGAITDAYSAFLDGVTTLLNNKAPLAGTFAFISSAFYKAIRLDASFIQASDIAQGMLANGQVGMVEGVPLIYAPASYLPTDVNFIITNRIAAVSPLKLMDYKVHDNPPGINGWLIEGRVFFDAFVLKNKKNAIYVHTAPTTPPGGG